MILILGDSNIRNTYEKYKQSLTVQVKEPVYFEFCTSVESLKLAAANREAVPRVFLYGSPMNEIITRIAKNKAVGRDETVKRVVREFISAVGQSAKEYPGALHLVVQPFVRQEPKWAEEKVTLILHYAKDSVRTLGLNNLAIGSPIEITSEDLGKDKIHLNDTGKEKLYGVLESDINKCLEDATTAMDEGESSQNSFCWASQMSDTSSSQTPLTLRKRQRTQDPEETESDSDSRKKSKIDALFDKMDVVLKEMRDDRSKTGAKVQHLETRIDEVDDKINTVAAKIEEMDDNNITAEMLQDVLGENAKEEVKYASTMYAYIDPTKKDNQKGLIPPFRIGFKTKDMGVKFREEAVKQAKQPGSKLSATYFTHCQSSATRIRVMLLWGIVDALKPNNQDVWVSQNASRPTLQIKENGKVKTHSFVKAMTEYGDKIPAKVIEEATKIGNKFYQGQLKKTFLILKD